MSLSTAPHQLSLGPPHFSPVSTRVDLQLLRLDFVGAMLGAGKMHCERHVFSGVSRTGPSAHLMRDKMREAIRGHQRSSEVGHQRSSGRSGGSPSSDWGRALPERDSRIFTSGDSAPLRSNLRPQRTVCGYAPPVHLARVGRVLDLVTKS